MEMTEQKKSMLEQEDEQMFFEPIRAKDECEVAVQFAESATWEVKETDDSERNTALNNESLIGAKFNACKLTLKITDGNVETEHEDAMPRLTFEDQFNLERYPYAKEGKVKWMARNRLFDLENALGFEPCYFDGSGTKLPNEKTKAGNWKRLSGSGVKRRLNPDFWNTYFTESVDDEGRAKATPNMDNWADLRLIAKVGVDKNERFGDRNTVVRYIRKA